MFWTSNERSDPKRSTTGMTSGHRDPGAALPKPEVYQNPSYFPHISAELLSISPVSAGLTPSSHTSHTCCTSPVPDTLYISLHAVDITMPNKSAITAENSERNKFEHGPRYCYQHSDEFWQATRWLPTHLPLHKVPTNQPTNQPGRGNSSRGNTDCQPWSALNEP
jgi:hypothetical protein